ncbi:hypothetical protein Lser_V15G00006 [Lactuca serriola]
MEAEGSSLPSNYVTILQLKERWLQQQHQNPAKSKPHDDEASCQPSGEAALRRVPLQRPNRPGVINQVIPEVAVDDSVSKTQVDAADNHPKGEEEQKTDHSNSKLSKKKKSSRAPKPRSGTNQNPNGGGSPLLVPEEVKENKQTQHVGGRRRRHLVCEPNDRMTVFAQSVDDLRHSDARGHGVVEAVAATVHVPIVSQRANRRSGAGRYEGKPKPKPSSDQNVVCEPNDKRILFTQNVDDSSHNDARGDGVVKAVADSDVNVPIVSQEANRRGGAGRFQGKPKPRPSESSFLARKGKNSLVWVKKGESSTN